MKKAISLILCFTILLSGCSPFVSQDENASTGFEGHLSKKFSGINDNSLLQYVEDLVYEETVKSLNSEEYVVEKVQAVYLSKEYLEEISYNSQSNMYFGYTIPELDNFFQGKRYIFTLGENGTIVQELQEITEPDSEEILKNVAIGTGIILVCVTISVVSAGIGAPAAITTIFMASAKTATTFAISSAAFGGISAGVVRGYQTGDIKEALNATTLGASEGFKWGAMSGAFIGGGKTALLLKAGTKGGLTMSQVALIQKESKYPIDIISKFNSMEQYEICKSAGLSAKMIDGKTALIREVDLGYIDELTGKTNLQIMQDGFAPLDSTGAKYQLHHIGQNTNSPLAMLTQAEHTGNGNDKIWHILTDGFENPSSQANWPKIRSDFWKDYAKQFAKGGF